MSVYRIQYADQAEADRRAMDRALRHRFETAMTQSLGTDPYGHGSTAIKHERDYREITVGGTFVVYYVSAEVLVVTALRIVHA